MARIWAFDSIMKVMVSSIIFGLFASFQAIFFSLFFSGTSLGMKRIEKRGLNLKFYWLMPGGYLPPKKLKRENGFAVL